jgi:archaellum biogenesis protein FlaJ (TadC family)
MGRKRYLATVFIFFIIFSIPITYAQDTTGPEITIISPQPGEIVRTTTPIIEVAYSDDESGIDTESVIFKIDGTRFPNDLEELDIRSTTLTFTVSELLRLSVGNHTVTIEISDNEGNKAIPANWTFVVNLTIPAEEEAGIDIFTIVIYILLGAGICVAVFAGYIYYLKKTKGFTWRKYFAQHPLQKKYLTIYIPIGSAFIFVIFSIGYISSTSNLPEFSYEFVMILGTLIAITPYALEGQLEKRLLAKYERAFAQFLFEMADAMRGGLDPAKAVLELAKTDTGVLSDRLKHAADAIKLGRPFNDIIQIMVRPFKSMLIQRYASLIGEASNVGGETSQVIHRAAKDMDDFIRTNNARRRELTMQTTIIYIAFIVLLVILYILLYIYPSLEGLDVSLLGATSIEGAESSVTPRMSLFTLKQRFFHIVLINAFGTGFIIGEFVDGRAKFGLFHSLILLAIGSVFFIALIL